MKLIDFDFFAFLVISSVARQWFLTIAERLFAPFFQWRSWDRKVSNTHTSKFYSMRVYTVFRKSVSVAMQLEINSGSGFERVIEYC